MSAERLPPMDPLDGLALALVLLVWWLALSAHPLIDRWILLQRSY